jgi:hypothetical protein
LHDVGGDVKLRSVTIKAEFTMKLYSFTRNLQHPYASSGYNARGALRACYVFISAVIISTGCGKSGNENNAHPEENVDPETILRDNREKTDATFHDLYMDTPDIKSSASHENENKVSGVKINEPSGLRLTAILTEETGLSRAGYVLESGVSTIVYEGQSVSGYYVESINQPPGEVVLIKNGVRYLSKITGENSAIKLPTAPASPTTSIDYSGITYLSEEVLGTLPREQFAPTADEIRRGIDPNNAATWPEAYRGPAIERAIQMQSAGP